MLGIWLDALERLDERHVDHLLYVGDAPDDLEMARRAGVSAIAVLGPFPIEDRLRAARPEYLLRSIEELPGLIRKLA